MEQNNIKKISLLISAAVATFSFSTLSFAAQTVHIYAASSMTNVIDTLAADYEAKHDVDVVPVYGGSSTLARQIEQGAPADIFISANVKWAQYLQNKAIIKPDAVKNVLRNDLVLVENVATEQALSGATDLDKIKHMAANLDTDRLAVAMTDSVPAGIYAKQAFETLNLWDVLADKLAPSANVRTTLAFVERGESPYGVVYRTDAMMSKKVNVAASFPDDSHDPIIYPFARINDTASTQAFYQYLLSDEAIKIYREYGFTPNN